HTLSLHDALPISAKVVAGKVTHATVSGDVEVNGRVVGKLSGAKVDDGVVHGPKKTDPVTVADTAGKKLGTIEGLAVEGGRLVAQPKHIPKGSKLSTALQKHPSHMESWGIDLAKRPGDAGT